VKVSVLAPLVPAANAEPMVQLSVADAAPFQYCAENVSVGDALVVLEVATVGLFKVKAPVVLATGAVVPSALVVAVAACDSLTDDAFTTVIALTVDAVHRKSPLFAAFTTNPAMVKVNPAKALPPPPVNVPW
jgi:hypothetical protein